MSDQRTDIPTPAAPHDEPGTLDEGTQARLRSPLVVGCIAYAILAWMILVVIVIYFWKVFGS